MKAFAWNGEKPGDYGFSLCMERKFMPHIRVSIVYRCEGPPPAGLEQWIKEEVELQKF
jgi:hypothetical protein